MAKQRRLDVATPLAFSIPESARQLGVSNPMVYRAIRDGSLVAFKLGRRTLVAASDLEQFVERMRVRPLVLADTSAATIARHLADLPK